LFPCFNTFYDFLRDEFVPILKEDRVKEKDFDVENFLYVLRPYYKGGEFDYLLNATENLELLRERFIVFELDNIKDHPILFPVVTIIIMEVFISKMRKLKGVRKMILIEEAWKAIAKEGMAEYIKYLFKTVRKFYGEAIVVNAGSRGHHFVSHCQAGHHQQLRLQDSTRPEQVPKQVRSDTTTAGPHRKRESTRAQYQQSQRSFPEIQRSVYQPGRYAVQGVCHRGFARRIPRLHHGGIRKNQSTGVCQKVER
jgi:hypothetical protein